MASQTISANFNEESVLNSLINKFCVLVLAGTMTLLLLSAMNYLIKNDSVPEAASPTKPIPPINSKVPDEIDTLYRDPEPPVRPVEHSQPPIIVEPIDPPTSVVQSIPVEQVVFEPPKPMSMLINMQPLPMVRFTPAYPQVAITKGIEGFVDVVFDVTETGAVENVQIVHAEPEKIFNSAVLKAVARWKYKPKTDDAGVPIRMYGLRERLRFNMEK
jgi:periplasmic protein TonB